MVRGPTDQQRTVILGRTGAGKSVGGIQLLAQSNFHEIPWVIIDYKGEDLLEDILEVCKGRIGILKPTDKPPTKPGLYYMKAMPKVDDEAIDRFLWLVHKQGSVGLYIDEGYCLPQDRSNAFDVILTQGRSLHIPVIILFQRPVYMSRFCIAQADFFALYKQEDRRDLKTTEQFTKPFRGPNNEAITVYDTLPPFWCLWYDVGRGVTSLLRPAPPPEEIIKTFRRRLRPAKQRVLV